MSAIQRYTYLAGKTPLGGQEVINLNYLALPFQASAIINIVSGIATYSVEFTHDDINKDPPYMWVTDTVNFPAGQTSSGILLIDFPVTAMRLNLQSFTGEVRFSVIQGVGTTI
jgi:hypothetical protein